MSKEGEGSVAEQDIHLICPDRNCMGFLYFQGLRDGKVYYKCITCEKEYDRPMKRKGDR